MATNTYVSLLKTTVSTATPSITLSLSGITGYTDLVLIANMGLSGASQTLMITFNNDTGSNYSFTELYGTGSTAGSSRLSNQTSIYSGIQVAPSTSLDNNFIMNIQNYSNTTTYKTTISRENSVTAGSYPGTNAVVGLWRSTSAISSISITPSNGVNLITGSTFSLYGIAAATAPTAKATGGTITYDASYIYHTFTSSGTFAPLQSLSCDVLTIAGGGGGGSEQGGGGGAGGLVYLASQSLSSSQSVTVGAGGAGNTNTSTGGNGVQGSNSVLGSLTTAIGGGYGKGSASGSGGTGGSGGGAAGDSSGTVYTGGSATSGQGFAGGNGGFRYNAGGGGGAGAVGGNYTSGNPGAAGTGGAGLNTYSSWASTTNTGVSGYYAGGGGGSSIGTSTASGGAGGGGAGRYNASGVAGTANTGGGGGGCMAASGVYVAGAGGSGIVIVRYAI